MSSPNVISAGQRVMPERGQGEYVVKLTNRLERAKIAARSDKTRKEAVNALQELNNSRRELSNLEKKSERAQVRWEFLQEKFDEIHKQIGDLSNAFDSDPAAAARYDRVVVPYKGIQTSIRKLLQDTEGPQQTDPWIPNSEELIVLRRLGLGGTKTSFQPQELMPVISNVAEQLDKSRKAEQYSLDESRKVRELLTNSEQKAATLQTEVNRLAEAEKAAQEAKSRADEAVQSLQKSKEGKEAEFQQLLEETGQKVSSLDDQVSRLKSENEQASSQVAELQRRIASFEAENTDQQIRDLSERNQTLELAKSNLSEQITSLQQEKTSVEDELQKAKDDADQVQNSIVEPSAEKNREQGLMIQDLTDELEAVKKSFAHVIETMPRAAHGAIDDLTKPSYFIGLRVLSGLFPALAIKILDYYPAAEEDGDVYHFLGDERPRATLYTEENFEPAIFNVPPLARFLGGHDIGYETEEDPAAAGTTRRHPASPLTVLNTHLAMVFDRDDAPGVDEVTDFAELESNILNLLSKHDNIYSPFLYEFLHEVLIGHGAGELRWGFAAWMMARYYNAFPANSTVRDLVWTDTGRLVELLSGGSLFQRICIARLINSIVNTSVSDEVAKELREAVDDTFPSPDGSSTYDYITQVPLLYRGFIPLMKEIGPRLEKTGDRPILVAEERLFVLVGPTTGPDDELVVYEDSNGDIHVQMGGLDEIEGGTLDLNIRLSSGVAVPIPGEAELLTDYMFDNYFMSIQQADDRTLERPEGSSSDTTMGSGGSSRESEGSAMSTT